MQADLIQLEIEQIRNQIELLDAMFDEYLTKLLNTLIIFLLVIKKMDNTPSPIS